MKGQGPWQTVLGDISFDAKGDIKDGTLTLYTFKDSKKEKIAVVK